MGEAAMVRAKIDVGKYRALAVKAREVCVCRLRHYCTNRVKCPGGSDQLVLQPFYPDHGRRWLCHTPSTGAIEWAPH